MNEIEKVKKYFAGEDVELPFVQPTDALVYFERVGNEVIIRSRQHLHPSDVVQFAANKTGFANWIIKYNYPIQANGVWEWRLA